MTAAVVDLYHEAALLRWQHPVFGISRDCWDIGDRALSLNPQMERVWQREYATGWPQCADRCLYAASG